MDLSAAGRFDDALSQLNAAQRSAAPTLVHDSELGLLAHRIEEERSAQHAELRSTIESYVEAGRFTHAERALAPLDPTSDHSRSLRQLVDSAWYSAQKAVRELEGKRVPPKVIESKLRKLLQGWTRSSLVFKNRGVVLASRDTNGLAKDLRTELNAQHELTIYAPRLRTCTHPLPLSRLLDASVDVELLTRLQDGALLGLALLLPKPEGKLVGYGIAWGRHPVALYRDGSVRRLDPKVDMGPVPARRPLRLTLALQSTKGRTKLLGSLTDLDQAGDPLSTKPQRAPSRQVGGRVVLFASRVRLRILRLEIRGQLDVARLP
jgi:hypothetical protein